MDAVKAIQFLETYGLYAIIVFLGIAYWRKDKQYSELLQNLVGLIEEKTKTDTKLESALNGLRDVIMALTGKLQ